jgi:GH25 family lysozyme M1 (1,4-beta-N-acetylmuramidase)
MGGIMTGTPQFADVSAFQPEHIDWQTYRAWAAQWDGKARVALRSSYGVGYVDQHFPAYYAGAVSAGVDIIYFYHYAYPSLNSPSAEADWQHHVCHLIREQDALVLDLEENVDSATADWAYQWLARQEANYSGKLPVLYSYEGYIRQRLQDSRLAKYPLWLARWTFDPSSHPPCPPPWTEYSLLQYTDKATAIPGIAGVVDCNISLETKGEPSMLTKESAAPYFVELDPTIWRSKNGFIVGHGILNFYRSFGGGALFGLTHLGLPLMNEMEISGVPGATIQRFERGVLVYDPDHKIDHAPGSGPVYLAHLDSGVGVDPRLTQALQQIVALQQQVGQLQNGSQLTDYKNRLSQIQTLSKV